MKRFLQIHALVSYPPSNLNRDDAGYPKTARMGGCERIRVSSQSLKRAWRMSDLFRDRLGDSRGTRTKSLGVKAFDRLIEGGIKEKDADKWAIEIASVFGKPKKEAGKTHEIEQLVHVTPEEFRAVNALIDRIVTERRAPTKEELDNLLGHHAAVDVALFGRMLAEKSNFNIEASAQVSHAIGVHASAIEDDYFTAVDDLKSDDDSDRGAAHIGEAGFASAVLYLYACIDRALLLTNLRNDTELTRATLRALTEAILTIGPSGKVASYGSHARAHFALLEVGDQQPRSLSLAFVRPIAGDDYATGAVEALERVRDNMDKVYGACADDRRQFNVLNGSGTLAELLEFAARD